MRSEERLRWAALSGAAAVVVGCAFPEHTFDDDEFYGTGAMDGGAGSGGAGGGASGTGGGAGTGASGGTGGSGGGGNTGGDCAGQCAPVPAGWQGPVALYLGAAAAAVPDCAGDFVTNQLNASTDLDPGAASCSPCSCGSAAGSSCAPPVARLWQEVGCSSGAYVELTPPPSSQAGDCLFVDLSAQPGFTVAGVTASAPTPTAACSVASGSGEITKATPSFTTRARACGLPGSPSNAGCGNDVCVPPLPSGFTSLCVHQPGDIPCAGSTFVTRHVVYGGFDDQRSCAACSCSASGGTCGGTLGVWSNAACSGNAEGTVTTLGTATCVGLAHSTQKSLRYTPAPGDPAGVACAPSGGELTGSATGTGPTTLCCL